MSSFRKHLLLLSCKSLSVARSGVFGATSRANPKYVSVRGKQDSSRAREVPRMRVPGGREAVEEIAHKDRERERERERASERASEREAEQERDRERERETERNNEKHVLTRGGEGGEEKDNDNDN